MINRNMWFNKVACAVEEVNLGCQGTREERPMESLRGRFWTTSSGAPSPQVSQWKSVAAWCSDVVLSIASVTPSEHHQWSDHPELQEPITTYQVCPLPTLHSPPHQPWSLAFVPAPRLCSPPEKSGPIPRLVTSLKIAQLWILHEPFSDLLDCCFLWVLAITAPNL